MINIRLYILNFNQDFYSRKYNLMMQAHAILIQIFLLVLTVCIITVDLAFYVHFSSNYNHYLTMSFFIVIVLLLYTHLNNSIIKRRSTYI
jgi:hypothetical protein